MKRHYQVMVSGRRHPYLPRGPGDGERVRGYLEAELAPGEREALSPGTRKREIRSLLVLTAVRGPSVTLNLNPAITLWSISGPGVKSESVQQVHVFPRVFCSVPLSTIFPVPSLHTPLNIYLNISFMSCLRF